MSGGLRDTLRKIKPLRELWFFLRIQAARLALTLRGRDNRGEKYINIGAGPHFPILKDWLILEEVVSYNNPFSFKLTKDCVFPVPDGAAELVYSSHCLEHLDDATVDRVLSESVRALKNDGVLLLKLPDFETVLNTWRERGENIFTIGFEEEILSAWARKGVAVSDINKISMLFCGFWNDAYGDHYSKKISLSPKAYHGPAPVLSGELESLLRTRRPHEITSALRLKVLELGEPVHFNHQNAWSRDELKGVLLRHNLEPLTFCAEEIKKRFAFVPGINEMESLSMYCLAGKKR